jgi:hypothetical protein
MVANEKKAVIVIATSGDIPNTMVLYYVGLDIVAYMLSL